MVCLIVVVFFFLYIFLFFSASFFYQQYQFDSVLSDTMGLCLDVFLYMYSIKTLVIF